MKVGDMFLVTVVSEDCTIYGLYRAKVDFEPKEIGTYWTSRSKNHPSLWVNWLLKQGFIESVPYEEFLF